jgi:hypothetical protein
MMKILTQKMLGAQGLEAGCQDFVISSFRSFQNPVISSAVRNLLSAGAGKHQVPRRFRSSE